MPGLKDDLTLACPMCRVPWPPPYGCRLDCSDDRLVFVRREGVWRFLAPDRMEHVRRFMVEYDHVRRAEGWGSTDSAYYRALPFRDTTGKFRALWRIRAQSYRALQEHVLAGGPQRVVDLGAGNAWLSNRLALAGHTVAGIDLRVDEVDGLGAHRHYDTRFLCLQAEFDAVPLANAQMDVVIYNGAFHYANDYEPVLQEAMRVLRPGGRIVIMDSPVYRDGGSGERMMQEQEESFVARFGVRGDALSREGYLTFDRLDELAATLSLTWTLVRPAHGWRWALRPWLARMRGGREPAAFPLIIGTAQVT
jgi:SAM-dependent methyltransferase